MENGGMAADRACAGAARPLPINMYARRGKLVIVAPMPGLEPENIVVTIGGGVLALHGQMRGELQPGKEYILQEWQVGPYIRVLPLPFPVDASRANVTYNNGILTVAVPEAAETVAQRIHLERRGATKGERAGFAGASARAVRPGGHVHHG